MANELNKQMYRTDFFVADSLYLVVCSRLVIVCVYGGIRVAAAPTVNGQSGKRDSGREGETIVLVWSTLYC